MATVGRTADLGIVASLALKLYR